MVAVVASDTQESSGVSLEDRKRPLLDGGLVVVGGADASGVEGVTQVVDFLGKERTLSWVQAEASISVGGEGGAQVADVDGKRGAMDDTVVKEANGNVLGDVVQDLFHESAVGGGPIGEAEPKPLLLETAPGSRKGCLFLVLLFHFDTVKGTSHVHSTEDGAASESGNIVLDGGHGKGVLAGDLI